LNVQNRKGNKEGRNLETRYRLWNPTPKTRKKKKKKKKNLEDHPTIEK
jgi:hypothetical protein